MQGDITSQQGGWNRIWQEPIAFPVEFLKWWQLGTHKQPELRSNFSYQTLNPRPPSMSLSPTAGVDKTKTWLWSTNLDEFCMSLTIPSPFWMFEKHPVSPAYVKMQIIVKCEARKHLISLNKKCEHEHIFFLILVTRIRYCNGPGAEIRTYVCSLHLELH